MLSFADLKICRKLSTTILAKVWTRLCGFFDGPMRALFIFFIAFYQSVWRFWFGGQCRFEPHCSEYAAQAFRQLSFGQAFRLTLNRLLRCRPGAAFGYDPLPAKENSCG